MWRDIRQAYRDTWRFAGVLPALFLVPAIVEFLQHVAEIEIGMYLGQEEARAVAAHPLRMAFGFAKVIALMLPGYWLTRYMAWHDVRRSWRSESPAVALFLTLLVIKAAVQAMQLFGPSSGAWAGLDARGAGFVTAALGVTSLILGIYLTAWFVAWPLGNAGIGPVRSVRVMAGSFWRTLGITVATALPLMLIHYALGYGAMGRSAALVWVMMAVDAIVVAFLAHAMAGGMFVAARTAAARKGASLIP